MKKTVGLFLAAGLTLLGLAACKPEPTVTPSITLSVAPTTLSLQVGSTETVTATVAPSGTEVTWTSSDEGVATVAGGVVTAIKAGKATITAKAGEKTATCEVTVTEAPVQYSITLSDEILSIEAGSTATLTATVLPEGTPVQWGSTNEEVATVEGGVISALVPGTATITASAGTITAQCIVTVTEKVVIDDGEGIAIDLCESNNGWQTTGELVLDMENKTQGGASLSTTLTEGDQVQIIFQKPFDTPVDASSIDYDKAVLSMDVWFEDVTKLNLGGNIEASQFEIGSSENPDQEEVSWPVSEWNIKNGWNHIELRFKGAKTNDQINMAQIKRIRWYHAAKIGSTTIKIDDIRIVERDASSTEKPSDPGAVYITHCEDVTGWEHVASLGLDMDNHQEGKACLSASAPGPFVWIFNLENAVDCSSVTKEKGHLSFDIYVSNAAGMKLNDGNGQIEISSTTKDDDAEYCWDIKSLNLKDGWNHIDLPLSTASVSGGEPNMAAINHFRFYHVGWETDSPVAVKLDNIRMRNLGQ